MEVYEAMFHVDNIEVYSTELYTSPEGVITELEGNYDEICETVLGRLDGYSYDPYDPPENNAEALALMTRCVNALKNDEGIDEITECGQSLFACILTRRIYDSYSPLQKNCNIRLDKFC